MLPCRCAQAEEDAQSQAGTARAKADSAKNEADKAKSMMEGARSATERSKREAIEAREEGELLRSQAAQMKQDFENLQAALQSWIGVEVALQAAESRLNSATEACTQTKQARAQQLATIMRSTFSEATQAPSTTAAPAASSAPPPIRMQLGAVKKKNKVR